MLGRLSFYRRLTSAGAKELIQFQRPEEENPDKGEYPHNAHEWA